ncbi:hypothetical protein SLS58_007802 [Diplodia intermedia]|uniref:histidine kinase n=1 Tax=Diplodia intermedia TaxID=856260 RepID=A0ABR3TJB5_9PEZI
MPDAFTSHELRRYADVLDSESPRSAEAGDLALALDPALANTSSLCAALDALAEVVAVRLNAFAAFITLTDGTTQHLLAGSWRDKYDSDDPHPPPTPQWLAPTSADRAAWLHLLRLTLGLNNDADADANNNDHNQNSQHERADASPTGNPITRCRLADDIHTAHLTCVNDAPNLRRFAAAPIVSARGIAIGAVFAVYTTGRMLGGQRNPQTRLLRATADKAMAQLEAARAVRLRDRVAALHGRLKSFVKFKDIVAQLSEESPMAHRHRREEREDGSPEVVGSQLHQEQELGEEDIADGAGLRGPHEGEAGALRRNHDNIGDPASVSVDSTADGEGAGGDKRGNGDAEDETTYRKVFARAAEGLRYGMDVDGVSFLNGLVGFHGLSIPIGEAEIELENEMAAESSADCQDDLDADVKDEDVDDSQTLRDGSAAPQSNRTATSHAGDTAPGSERTFISTEYERSVIARRPAECLGLSVVHDKWPILKHVGKRTVGLKDLDEGFLQRLLHRFPDGSLWYFDEDGTPYTFSPDDDRLISAAGDDDLRQVSKSFPGVRQLFFAPLTDPTSLKRLAGCLAWTTRLTPLFTVAADLDIFKSFLSSVESEISRIDAISAVKQQEAFVSSVSHELRTPLHGILGAVEFLSDTDLDDFQHELAETIRSCSSTLHETLSSVLAYAKINQFERRRDKPILQQRTVTQPSPWAMEDKDLGRETADTQGTLFCVADVAVLCEGVVEVTASGYAFGNDSHKDVSVVLDIPHRHRWTFVTEPAVLKRILSNILGNALKYTDSGFIRVSLGIGDTQDDRSKLGVPSDDGRKLLVLTVADSGRGISRDFLQKHLFSPFTQENAVASEGVGLGMSIVKSMVGLLGGKVLVVSSPGEGTTFTVSLPMQEHAEDDIPTSDPSAAMMEVLPKIRECKRTVAFCGFDDKMLCESMAGYFRDWFQWEVVQAGESPQRSSRVDIVVVDGTGDAAMKALHDSHVYASAHLFIAALERPTRTNRRNSAAAGSQARIEVTTTRPIGPLKLCKAVSSCLSRLAEVDQGKTIREVDACNGESQSPTREMASTMADGADKIQSASPPPPSRPPPSAEEEHSRSSSPSTSPHRKSSAADAEPPPLPERPRRPPPPPAPPETTSPADPHSSSSPAKEAKEKEQQPRLLLVEDNMVNLKLLQTFLKKHNYTNLTAAENGQIAVDAVIDLGESNRCFDVIFMDISMPVMDGFAATVAIRRLEREKRDDSGAARAPVVSTRPPAYIVALTGLAGTKDEERAYTAGIDLVLTKPVKFKELKEVLDRWGKGERVSGRVGEGNDGVGS